MAKYEILEPSYIGGRIYKEGEILETSKELKGRNVKRLDEKPESKKADGKK